MSDSQRQRLWRCDDEPSISSIVLGGSLLLAPVPVESRRSSVENFLVGDEVAPQLDTWFAAARVQYVFMAAMILSLWTGFFGWT